MRHVTCELCKWSSAPAQIGKLVAFTLEIHNASMALSLKCCTVISLQAGTLCPKLKFWCVLNWPGGRSSPVSTLPFAVQKQGKFAALASENTERASPSDFTNSPTNSRQLAVEKPRKPRSLIATCTCPFMSYCSDAGLAMEMCIQNISLLDGPQVSLA